MDFTVNSLTWIFFSSIIKTLTWRKTGVRIMPLTEAAKPQRMFHLDVARAVNRAFENYGGQMEEFMSIPLTLTVIKTVVTVFSHVCVLLFLMISGVLLLSRPLESQQDIRHFYKHNLLSLFVTAEIWYVIMCWVIVLLDPSNTVLENGGIMAALRVSVLYFSGADPVSISKRLGHAQVSTTQNIYSHLIEQADTQSAERIADAIFRREKRTG